MMGNVVREGSGTAAALAGIDVAGKTGTAEINLARPQPAVVHRLRAAERAARRRRRDDRERPGRAGRHRRRADRQGRDGGAAAVTDRRRHRRRRPLPGDRAPRLGRHGRRLVRDDLQLGRKVALKLLHGRFAEDAEFVERFRREASAAAGLQHPHVVSVYDRGEWDGTSYIAMEFLEGRTLKQVIRDEARSTRRARSISRSRSCAPRASPTAAASSTATSSRTTSSSTTRAARRSPTSASPARARRT